MKKRICLFLLALMLLMSACAPGGAKGSSTDTADTTESVGGESEGLQIQLVKDHFALYQIVYPVESDPQVASAADVLRGKLLELTGFPFMTRTDDRGSSGKKEIVIGNCDRDEMQTALSAITYRDYAVTVTDSGILIAGYEPSKIADAVYSFIGKLTKENLIITEDSVFLKWEGDYQKLHKNYKFESLSIQGVDLSQYRIVYPQSLNLDAYIVNCAKTLQNGIGRRCGAYLPIVSDAEPAQPYEILLGETNRPESAAYYESAEGPDSLECGLTVKNGKLLLACGVMPNLSATVQKFDNYLNTATSGSLDSLRMDHVSLRNVGISECGGDYRIMSYNIMNQGAGWSGILSLLELPFATRAMNVASQINQCRPDVLFLQERFEIWAGIGTDAVDLVSILGDEYVIVENRITYPIAGGKTESAITRSPIVYRADTFRCVESGHQILTERVSTQNSSVKAAVVWAVLEDITDSETRGQRILVCTTHWGTTTTLEGEDNEWLQRQQSEETQAVIRGVLEKYGCLPVMFGGDLNMHHSFGVYQDHLEALGLKDADATVNGEENVQDVVDHIAASGVEILAYKLLTEANDCSDHYPIYCDVLLPRAGKQ